MENINESIISKKDYEFVSYEKSKPLINRQALENESKEPIGLLVQTHRTRRPGKNQNLLQALFIPFQVAMIRDDKKHHIKSSNEWTPSMFAARFGQKRILKYFLEVDSPGPQIQ